MFLFENKTQSARLRYKSLKIIQQELSLPVIPERIKYTHTNSSPTPPYNHHTINIQSDEPVCPQEQRLEQNIRIALGSIQNNSEVIKNQKEKRRRKRSNSSLPKLQIIQKIRTLSAKQIHEEALKMAKRPQSAKRSNFDISLIFREKEKFIGKHYKRIK